LGEANPKKKGGGFRKPKRVTIEKRTTREWGHHIV